MVNPGDIDGDLLRVHSFSPRKDDGGRALGRKHAGAWEPQLLNGDRDGYPLLRYGLTICSHSQSGRLKGSQKWN